MAKHRTSNSFWTNDALRKFALSAFVVSTFVAYGLHDRSTEENPSLSTIEPPARSASAPTQNPLPTSVPQQSAASQRSQAAAPTTVQQQSRPVSQQQAPAPTAVPPMPTATPQQQGRYRDGTYVGSTVDAYYGYVQVEAVVQNGSISDVQFLKYPQDRRTSRFINSQAVPWLRSEALQVQSANVNIISGATLTSEGFIMSLRSALDQA